MTAPLQDVRPGQPVQFSAASTNAWNAAARGHLAGRHSGASKPRPDQFLGGVPDARVRNGSGADVGRFGILMISGSVFDPDLSLDGFLETPVLTGITPTSNPEGIFVVTHEPIRDGEIGFAHLSGLVPCPVEITHSSHTHATLKNSDATQLTSAMFGHRIYYKPSGTGDKVCYVIIGAESCNPYKAVAVEEVSPNTNGAFKFATGEFGNLEPIGEEFEGWYPGGEDAANVPEDAEILVSRIQGQWVQVPLECPV